VNRLVDESAFSFKETYLWLEKEIHHSASSKEMKEMYLKNLDIAYTTVYRQLVGDGGN